MNAGLLGSRPTRRDRVPIVGTHQDPVPVSKRAQVEFSERLLKAGDLRLTDLLRIPRIAVVRHAGTPGGVEGHPGASCHGSRNDEQSRDADRPTAAVTGSLTQRIPK